MRSVHKATIGKFVRGQEVRDERLSSGRVSESDTMLKSYALPIGLRVERGERHAFVVMDSDSVVSRRTHSSTTAAHIRALSFVLETDPILKTMSWFRVYFMDENGHRQSNDTFGVLVIAGDEDIAKTAVEVWRSLQGKTTDAYDVLDLGSDFRQKRREAARAK
jgi:hypothetical protein